VLPLLVIAYPHGFAATGGIAEHRQDRFDWQIDERRKNVPFAAPAT
jgi:hypothetical protein